MVVTYSELNLQSKPQLGQISMKYEEKLKTLFNLNHLAPSHLQVNKDIVSGLKYVQHTYRTGVKGKVRTLATVPNSASQGHVNVGLSAMFSPKFTEESDDSCGHSHLERHTYTYFHVNRNLVKTGSATNVQHSTSEIQFYYL